MVNIAGKNMSVADAIEKKNSISYEKSLLFTLKQQLVSVTSKIEEMNINMDSVSDTVAQNLAGKDTKINPESLNYLKKFMQDVKEPKMVDGLKIKDKINDLDEFITEFEKEVDFTLSESNTRTEIEV